MKRLSWTITHRSVACGFHLIFGLAALVAHSSAIAQAKISTFTADQVVTMGGHISVGPIHVTGNAIRVEDTKRRMVTIARLDRKIAWILLPDQRTYMELPWQGSPTAPASNSAEKLKREAIASEIVAGYHCSKERVTTAIGEKTFVTMEWAAKEFGGLVVKRTDEKGTWSVMYTNVRVEPQPATLFEIPAGYKLVQMTGMQH